jgi:hypothetical protein
VFNFVDFNAIWAHVYSKVPDNIAFDRLGDLEPKTDILQDRKTKMNQFFRFRDNFSLRYIYTFLDKYFFLKLESLENVN